MVFGPIDLVISGGVRAPFFHGGRHTNAEWLSTIRDYPAPWAEIGTERLMVTVPSSEARKLTDPQAVVDLYDKYMDMFADLAVVSGGGWGMDLMSTCGAIRAGAAALATTYAA